MSRTRRIETVMPWLFVAGLVSIWELGCLAFRVPSFVLPRPTTILISLYAFGGEISKHSLITLARTLIGFGLAIVLGVILGFAIGTIRLIYRGLYPVLVAFNSIPKVIVIPLFVIWFGIGSVPAVLAAFLVSFFPIAVNVATGLATIEPELLDVLRSLGARRGQILRKIGLPRSMPYFFASLKIAVTLAFIGAIMSETVASNNGIGYLMMSATSTFDTPLVFAGLLVTSTMAIALYGLFTLLEQRLTFWAKRDNGLLA